MRRILALTVILSALLPGQLMAADTPVVSVKTATDTLLAKLAEVKPVYKSDPKKFFFEVDISLAPFIDFDGFSRGVMAKYYRRASPAQQQRFSQSFRESLVHTYAKALVEFDNQKVVVMDEAEPQREPDRASVHLQVYGSDGTIYPIEYSLALIDDKWKLRNVVINGINIGLQFRSQFAASMQQYKNDIDKVIDNWNVDVKS